MKPTVGRIVHYFNKNHSDAKPRAAIIIRVTERSHQDCEFDPPSCEENSFDVDLNVFQYWGNDMVKNIRFGGEPGQREYWIWPPREG